MTTGNLSKQDQPTIRKPKDEKDIFSFAGSAVCSAVSES
jgi:hypothetical protein